LSTRWHIVVSKVYEVVGSDERRTIMSKVWFITGGGRGMGVDFAKAALAAGFAVVATGQNTDAVTVAVQKEDI
jgi:NAD(P)-dependent dehydrogenase (short-subunit alcohol dehydrogenase family)